MTLRLVGVLNHLTLAHARAPRVLLLAPKLTNGCVVSADLAYCPTLRYAAVDLRLEAGPRVSRVRERLAFWCAREGGWLQDVGALTAAELDRFNHTFDRCESARRSVAPAGWVDAVGEVFGATGLASFGDVPTLELDLGGPAWEAISYDPAARLIWVPSPLALPAGDELQLAIRAGAEVETAEATVVSVRHPRDAGPGAPAGFAVAIGSEAVGVDALLRARCPREHGAGNTRSAPRFRAGGAVRVDAVAEDAEVVEYRTGDELRRDWLENLSHGGAFIRTKQPRRRGDHVTLRLRLPDDSDLDVSGTVVYQNERGIGVQFSNATATEARLAAALARLPGARRRVLVVDDDELARRMLVEALEASGLRAEAVKDGEAGLRAIAEELFSLDAVVTDLNMPGFSGDALVSAVRQAGGEQDLSIVVVAATLDAAHARALVRAGADAVVPKDRGADAIVAAVIAAIAARTKRAARGERAAADAAGRPAARAALAAAAG